MKLWLWRIVSIAAQPGRTDSHYRRKNKPANADELPVPLLVTVKFRGRVSDVEEAMRAAEEVAKAQTGIVCSHIIPNPTEDTEKMLTISALDKD